MSLKTRSHTENKPETSQKARQESIRSSKVADEGSMESSMKHGEGKE